MPIAMLESSKKRKRNPKFFGLHTFAKPGCLILPSGPFRDNIRYFLRECSEPKEYSVEGMPIWCTFLVHEYKGVVIPLYTIEECVKHSLQPFCDQCRCTGKFSVEDVSKKRNMELRLLHGVVHGHPKTMTEGVLFNLRRIMSKLTLVN